MNGKSVSSSEFVTTQRRNGRHQASDPCKHSLQIAVDLHAAPERRPRGERRRQVDPATCEKDYSEEEIVFIKAMDQYKRSNRRPFPTWSEVLEVFYSLGYRRIEEPTALPGLPVSSEI